MNDEDKKAAGILGGALLGAAGVGAYAYYKTKNALPSGLGDLKEGLGEVTEKAKEAGQKTREFFEDFFQVAKTGIEQPKQTAQVVSTVFQTLTDAGVNPSSVYIPKANVAAGPLGPLLVGNAGLVVGMNAGYETGQYIGKVINDAGEEVYILSEALISEGALAQFKSLASGVYGLATAVGFVNNDEPTPGKPTTPTQPDPQVPISEQPTGGTLMEQLQRDFSIEKITLAPVKHNGEWVRINVLNVTAGNFLAGAYKANVTQWMKQATGIDWQLTTYSSLYSDMRVCAAYLNDDGFIRYTLLDHYMPLISPESYNFADIVREVPAKEFVLFRPKLFRLEVRNGKTYIKAQQPTFYRSLVSLITTSGNPVPTLLDLTMRENGDIPRMEHWAFNGTMTEKQP